MSAPQHGTIRPIEEGLAHHRAGRVEEAEAIYRAILAVQPRRADALYLLGMTELHRGRAESASELIAKALEISPNHAEAHNGLGLVAQRQNRLNDAVGHFRSATQTRPGWGVGYFNLGLALKQGGDLAGAASAFANGWLSDPCYFDTASQCVATIAEQVKSSLVSPPVTRFDPSGHVVSVVFCSTDDAKCERATLLYHQLLADTPHEVIAIRDAHSLAEAYNRALRQCRGDLIILSHDDIDIVATDFAARLVTRLQTFDVVGVVGSTEINGPQWKSSGHPHLRGWITHLSSDGSRFVVGVLNPCPVAQDIVMLDGVFLAAHRYVFSDVTFDEDEFDGFHLYDIDWSYRAAQAGFRLGVAGDLLIVHESRGRFGDEWLRYAERFCTKHRIEPAFGAPAMLFEAEFETREQVRQFYARLEMITAT